MPDQPRIKQGHGNRIRLFAGGARQAQNAQGMQAAGVGQTLAGQTAQCGKRFGIPKKPGLGHDHRFDQRLLLIVGTDQALPVVIVVGHVQRQTALAHGTLDNRQAHGRDVQPYALLQKIVKALVVTHASPSALASSRLGGNSSAHTAGLNRSSTWIHCSKPWASSRTGPRYGASRLSRP